VAETSVLPVIESETESCTFRYRRLRLASTARVEAPRPAIAETSPLAYVLSLAERQKLSLPNMVDCNLRRRATTYLASDYASWQKVDSREAWEKFRDPRITTLRNWMGAFPARTPLDGRVTKEYTGQGYRRQDLIYQSRPGLW